MELDNLPQLEAVFHALLELPDEERRTAAMRLSGGDAELARRALNLVESDEQADVAQQVSRTASPGPMAYGPYRTERLVGAGGMGSVYLARRADGQFEQTVAVKVIAPYAAGEAFRDRFLAERQILAGLNHPNIAKLLDGGVTPDGTPYLVLEYVEGQPLNEYCDQRKLDICERLELFRRLCEPIAYAHRNLVVHRDLKPSNILVTGDARPMLLDFGTAKLMAGSRTAGAATLPMLTLRYSSPEQRNRSQITTSTDIFSLGVILYELLTGAWPFGDPESPEHILQSFGREMAMTVPADSITETAAQARASDPRALRGQLAGDLTSVLAKALSPQPEMRYDSVQSLSGDVANWLEGRPVSAKPATLSYRAGKFIRRHLASVAVSALAVIALLTVTGFAIYQARLARDRYTDLRSLTASLLFELKDAITDVPGSTPAQKILVSRVVKNLDKMAHSSQDADLQVDLAEAYRQLGELQGSPYSQNLGDAMGALGSLEKARSMAGEGLRKQPRDAAWLHLAGFTEATAAEVHFGSGETAQGIACATRAVDYYEAMAPLTRNAAWLSDAAAAHGVLGDMLGQVGTASLTDPEHAATQYRRAIELDQAAIQFSPELVRPRRGIALFRMKIGDLIRTNDPETALKEFQDALGTFHGLSKEELSRPANRRFEATFLRKTGNALRDLQEWKSAIERMNEAHRFFRAQYASDPTDERAMFDLSVVLDDLSDIYAQSGDDGKALVALQQSGELLEKLLRKQPQNVVWQSMVAYHEVRLATTMSRVGRGGEAMDIGARGLKEELRIASAKDAAPRDVQLAAEACTEIEPKSLRDPRQGVELARRYLATTGKKNVTALQTLATALQTAGEMREATATAQQGLALLAPVRNGRIPYLRKRLEAIR